MRRPGPLWTMLVPMKYALLFSLALTGSCVLTSAETPGQLREGVLRDTSTAPFGTLGVELAVEVGRLIRAHQCVSVKRAPLRVAAKRPLLLSSFIRYPCSFLIPRSWQVLPFSQDPLGGQEHGQDDQRCPSVPQGYAFGPLVSQW